MKKTILHIVEPFATGTFMFVVNLSNEQCSDTIPRVAVKTGWKQTRQPYRSSCVQKTARGQPRQTAAAHLLPGKRRRSTWQSQPATPDATENGIRNPFLAFSSCCFGCKT